jgi:hypothetical protein
MTRRSPALAALALVALVALVAADPAPAQGGDVAQIQAREARNADARTLAALERFRQALIAKVGGDPMLAMLEFGESEAAALIVRPGGARELLIRQGDRWIGTENRKLEPWAGAAVATANAFALSSVRATSFQAWIDRWRTIPGQATDFIMKFEMGYDPAVAKVVIKARVGSLTTGKIAAIAFDPASGQPVTIAAAATPPAPKAPPRKSDDLRRDVAIAIVALRREVPATRLGAVRIGRREIEFTLADRSTWRFDTAHVIRPGPRYDGSFLCERGWSENDVDWARLRDLPRNGVLAAGLDDEDEAHARFVVDRPRDCGGLAIEVVYDNDKTPQPRVRFDPQGRLQRSSR